jgi:[acyl-carrier-protein] S-malonyltransferase
MRKIAFIFPGQASQYPGMGKELSDKYESARRVFEEADRILGFALGQLCFSGPEEELKLTENTQPAILAVSVAAYSVLAEKGVRPDYVAGHSLGEYSAVVATGALGFAEALQLVRKRGRYMQEAVPVGQGAMAVVLGLGEDVLDSICKEVSQGEVVSLANLNSPSQIVIAGAAGAVERAVRLARERGAKRVAPLPVSAPFHCALMRPAELQLQRDIAQLQFSNPVYPLVNNVDAAEVTSDTIVASSLVRQVCSPVRWAESMQLLIRQGVEFFVEVGPGRVLSGLLRQIDRNAKLTNVGDEKSLNETLTLLSQSA